MQYLATSVSSVTGPYTCLNDMGLFENTLTLSVLGALSPTCLNTCNAS